MEDFQRFRSASHSIERPALFRIAMRVPSRLSDQRCGFVTMKVVLLVAVVDRRSPLYLAVRTSRSSTVTPAATL